ncbi:hypothetical protein BC567DRAFT_205733 [Phyllosticta citribraziliensis]
MVIDKLFGLGQRCASCRPDLHASIPPKHRQELTANSRSPTLETTRNVYRGERWRKLHGMDAENERGLTEQSPRSSGSSRTGGFSAQEKGGEGELVALDANDVKSKVFSMETYPNLPQVYAYKSRDSQTLVAPGHLELAGSSPSYRSSTTYASPTSENNLLAKRSAVLRLSTRMVFGQLVLSLNINLGFELHSQWVHLDIRVGSDSGYWDSDDGSEMV